MIYFREKAFIDDGLRTGYLNQTDDFIDGLLTRSPQSILPTEQFNDSSFDIDPLDELDAIANVLDSEEWGSENDDDNDGLRGRSGESTKTIFHTFEAPLSASTLSPRSPGSIRKTETVATKQDDGILWPFLRPAGEILYEKIVFCMFMFIFIVKEILFAMVAYADMLVCTFVLNVGLFILHRLWLCRDRKFINPLRLLKRKERSQTIFKILAAAIYVWVGVALLTKSKDNHKTLSTLPAHDLEAIRAAVRNVLPNYVPLNPHTGKIDLASAVNDEYVRRSELPVNLSELATSMASIPTWQEFMKENNHAVEAFVEKTVGELWQRFLEENSQVLEYYVQSAVKKYEAKQHKFAPTTPEDDRTSTEAYIAEALQTYHQDMLGIPDFALATRGGRIIRKLTSSTYDPRPFWKASITRIFGTSRGTVHHSPIIALLPDTHVGQCWPMAGSTGSLGVMMSEPIVVKAITVEYPSRQMGVNMTSAPKDIEVWGLPLDGYKETADWEYLVFLGSFTYEIAKNTPVQTFLVKAEKPTIIKSVLFRFKSNWGLDTYTCIYRIRVHGDVV
ncbi:UNC-like C-terminal-domain-containing protein [Dichotomocladium elegans]|nr:UNC-like C-terminal-domain-containing protein [Dichotomocladium elegans]